MNLHRKTWPIGLPQKTKLFLLNRLLHRFLKLGLALFLLGVPSLAQDFSEEPGFREGKSPYLDYGDFDTERDEEKEELFYKYGRFFGVGLGLGYQQAMGNRGLLYEPGFPRIDIKVLYWFDFNWSLILGVGFASHDFVYENVANSVRLTSFETQLRYSIDTKNLSDALTFASPYFSLGVGAISKTQNTGTQTQADSDSTISMNFGAGLEFPIAHKKSYLLLDGRYYTQSFVDSAETEAYSRVTPNLNGGFLNLSLSIVFTW